MKYFVLTMLLNAVWGIPLSGNSCSEECVTYLLSDPAGPKLLRLYKELIRPDTGSLTSIDVNGQRYEVSVMKANLITNAIRKGIKETVIENMLDDAAIVPQTPTKMHVTQQRIEPFHERRTSYEPLSGGYRIYTTKNGNVNINVKGQTLRVPEDLTNLPHIVTDNMTLREIIKQLKELGVPISQDGDRVRVGTSSSPQGLTLGVSIKKIDDKPHSVTITANDEKYTLPDDENRLNRFISHEPEVAYHLLRILSTHGVPVEYDSKARTLKTKLTPEEKILSSRLSPTNSQSSRLLTTPKIVRISSNSYYLPEDWDRLKGDIKDGRVSARIAVDTLNTETIFIPDDVMATIQTKFSTAISTALVKRYEDEVTIRLGSKSYKLPGDHIALEQALRDNDFPLEVIRDSLLRVGIDSRRVGSIIRVLTPGGDAFLTRLPTAKQYNYKIVARHGGVQVTANDEVYNLPSDRTQLEHDIAQKKVLPRTLVDAFNDAGISSNIDIEKQEMTVDLTSGLLRIHVPINSVPKNSSRLRLSARGFEGNKVYTLTVGDSGTDKIELPLDVHVLNNYIRSGKVDSGLLLELLSRMGVSHYYDSTKKYNIVTMNNKTYEIENSQAESGLKLASISRYCSSCKSEEGNPRPQERIY